jgi:deoxyadenosine/deoxycytidine kinase
MSEPPVYPGPKVIGICGGIAAGKSTFGKNFQQKASERWDAEPEVVFEEEKVVQPLLSAYLKNPEQYGAHFQTVMGMAAAHRQQRAQYLRDAQSPQRMILIERPLWENVTFAEANVRFGSLTKEYYDTWYMEMIKAFHESHPDLLIYLHASDKVRAYRRGERNRTDEDLYKDRYMNMLGDCYFEFVLKHAEKRKLLVLNWNSYGDMSRVVKAVADVLNGKKKLPKVTRNELNSSGESSEEGAPQQFTARINGRTTYYDTRTTKKRRKAQDLIVEALARFEDVEISS